MKSRMLGVAALLACSLAVAHPTHETWTEMRFNPESGSFELAMKLLPEDLAASLGSDRGEPADLSDVAAVTARLGGWLERHYAATVDGEALEIRVVGYEYSHEAAWVYFEIPWSGEGNELVIASTLMLDRPGQLNQVYVEIGRQRKSLLFTAASPRQSIQLSSRD